MRHEGNVGLREGRLRARHESVHDRRSARAPLQPDFVDEPLVPQSAEMEPDGVVRQPEPRGNLIRRQSAAPQ